MSSKKNNGFVIRIVSFILILCVGIFAVLQILTIPAPQNDPIQINRIEDTVTQNWEQLSGGDYSSFSYPFTVLDKDEKFLFSYGNPESVTLQDVMRHSDVALPIVCDHTVVGTVIIETHKVFLQKQMKSTYFCVNIVIELLLISLLVIFLYDRYLTKNIIKPFHQIDAFARRLSLGDFDASLNIKGNPAFLPLIQGLDIMREELRTAKQREFEANQSKKALVASLSHDIKTPITSIKLAVEVLQVKTTEPELKDRLGAIMTKTEQIDHLVTDLFHTTMEDMDELKISSKEIYSTELIDILHDADINCIVKQLELPECMIKIDPVRMGQVFTNIIYNSYKYAGTAIDVTGSVKEWYLQISLQDYGPGVDSEELPCIFNRFYRGSNTGNQNGSGLGLYICKCLIEKMDGEIYCNNNDKGFETLIRIPLV